MVGKCLVTAAAKRRLAVECLHRVTRANDEPLAIAARFDTVVAERGVAATFQALFAIDGNAEGATALVADRALSLLKAISAHLGVATAGFHHRIVLVGGDCWATLVANDFATQRAERRIGASMLGAFNALLVLFERAFWWWWWLWCLCRRRQSRHSVSKVGKRGPILRLFRVDAQPAEPPNDVHRIYRRRKLRV
jgi:hypothetical protein